MSALDPAHVNAMSARELTGALEALWSRAPELRPRPDMHDYALTYPPAVQLERPPFRRTPDDRAFVRLAIGDHRAAGYYFHFGFCQYRCRYCFHYEIKTSQDVDLMARYVNALALEMKKVRSLTRGVRTGLFFLGGGTPTALPTALIERFLGSLLFHFGAPPTTMSTVEAKPVTATDDKLAAFVQAGFRRINLGVQTLDPELYAFHHQGEELRVALDAIDRARKTGFQYVNIDVMSGLERQTPESWARTLAALERLAKAGAVDSVFLYPFHDDPRSRTFRTPERVPPFVETAHTDAEARALFERLGWSELGARFYRSPRHVRGEIVDLVRTRVNPAYGEVLYHGFGNSSFSIGDQATYLNHRDVRAYCDAVESGALGVSHFTAIDDEQRATRDVTFDLLYSPVTRVRSRAKKYGEHALGRHRRLLHRWAELGLGEENRLLGTFSLTPLGKLVHQQIIPEHYLPRDRELFTQVMSLRKEAGTAYRGY